MVTLPAQPTQSSSGSETVSPPPYTQQSKSEAAISYAISYLEGGTAIDQTATAVIEQLIVALVCRIYQKK